MLVVLGMQSTPLLPSLPGPLWPGVVAPDKFLFMSSIQTPLKIWLYPSNAALFVYIYIYIYREREREGERE